MKSYNKSYVYLICDPSQDLYKIGVTKNLHTKRMKQLQTGNGTELHITNFYMTYFPYRIEKYLHDVFSTKRENGEWFRLNIEDITSFKEKCEKYEKIIKALEDNDFFNKNLR